MTNSFNFPQKKFARRLGALERLLKREQELLTRNSDHSGITRIQKEIEVLQQRTSGSSGRKSTKNVKANTGRK